MHTLETPFLCAAILCSVSLTAAGEPIPAADFLQNWADAWTASNVDTMIGYYDEADETTAVESLGRIRKGPLEIREMYEGAFEELIFERVTLKPIAQGRHGSTAWATCRYRADIRLKSDNSRHVLQVVGSFVLKQDGDGWKISLEHFSAIPGVPRVRPAGPQTNP